MCESPILVLLGTVYGVLCTLCLGITADDHCYAFTAEYAPGIAEAYLFATAGVVRLFCERLIPASIALQSLFPDR